MSRGDDQPRINAAIERLKACGIAIDVRGGIAEGLETLASGASEIENAQRATDRSPGRPPMPDHPCPCERCEGGFHVTRDKDGVFEFRCWTCRGRGSVERPTTRRWGVWRASKDHDVECGPCRAERDVRSPTQLLRRDLLRRLSSALRGVRVPVVERRPAGWFVMTLPHLPAERYRYRVGCAGMFRNPDPETVLAGLAAVGARLCGYSAGKKASTAGLMARRVIREATDA